MPIATPKKRTRTRRQPTATTLTTIRQRLRECLPDSVVLNSTSDEIDGLINDLAAWSWRTLQQTQDDLVDRAEPALATAFSNHCGALMAAYGTAGYRVGVAMGLELAMATLDVPVPDRRDTSR